VFQKASAFKIESHVNKYIVARQTEYENNPNVKTIEILWTLSKIQVGLLSN
jgi:hypothetical protein